MKFRNLANSLLPLAILAGCGSAPPQPLKARITEFGRYDRGTESVREDTAAPSGQSRGSSGYRLKETTEMVALRLGESFGFCYEVSGFAPGARPAVVIQTDHPPFSRPGGTSVSQHQFVRNLMPSEGLLSDCTGYGFDHPFELVPGNWRFTVVVDGKNILTQAFSAR
ncbi:MAG: DUF3859 domain-containing protein [Rhizobacter sp.]